MITKGYSRIQLKNIKSQRPSPESPHHAWPQLQRKRAPVQSDQFRITPSFQKTWLPNVNRRKDKAVHSSGISQQLSTGHHRNQNLSSFQVQTESMGTHKDQRQLSH